jgi:hypothetical protein
VLLEHAASAANNTTAIQFFIEGTPFVTNGEDSTTSTIEAVSEFMPVS